MKEKGVAQQEQKDYRTQSCPNTFRPSLKASVPGAVLWLDEVGRGDAALVGQKAANLGALSKIVQIPRGCCLTTEIFRQFMKDNGIWDLIMGYLVKTSPETLPDIENASKVITSKIRESSLSERYKIEILQKCQHLRTNPVVVRSSATAEDLARASFAGQYSSYLDVRPEHLLKYIKLCIASIYSVRGIHYRMQVAVEEDNIGFAVLVQEIIDATTAGVMFTANPITSNRKEMVIEATYGLGELVVSGQVTPDYYTIDKSQLIVKERKIRPKREAMRVIMGYGIVTEHIPIGEQEKSSLSNDQINQLSQLGIAIEKYFSTPQDIEWAIDKHGTIFILQSRQITNLSV